YELFALQPSLQHLRGLPYVFGEGEAPVFSADDRWLAMMWETYNDWWSDDTPSSSNQERMIDWGELAVQEVPHGEVRCVPVRVRVPADWQPDGGTAPTGLRFESAHKLRVRTPWGTEPSIPFPPPKDGPIEIG